MDKLMNTTTERTPALGLTTPLTFGKYQGLTVESVAKFDPAYLLWIKQNVTRLEWADDALAYAKKAWSRDYRQKMDRQNAWAWGFGRDARDARDRQTMKRLRIEIEENARHRRQHD